MATKSTKSKKAAKSKRTIKRATKTDVPQLVQAPSGVTARAGSVRAMILDRCSAGPVPVTTLLDAAAEMGKAKVTVYRQLRECGFEVETGSRLVMPAK